MTGVANENTGCFSLLTPFFKKQNKNKQTWLMVKNRKSLFLQIFVNETSDNTSNVYILF